jgi:CBS domain-containing protein
MTTARATLEKIGIVGRSRWPRVPMRRPTENSNTALWIGLALVAVPVVAMLTRRTGRWIRRRTVEDVMIENVMTIDANAPLTEAAQRMREGNVGALPVLENGKLRGLITDRDIVVRAIARGADPRTSRVVECATDQPVAARPEWSVDDAMEAMAGSRIGRLPVVDAQDHVIGIVTLSSLALRSRNQDEALETAQAVSRRSARSA